MRAGLGLLIGFTLFALAAPGCGPALKEEELGRVIFDVGDAPKADQRYDLPDVRQPSPPESGTEPADES